MTRTVRHAVCSCLIVGVVVVSGCSDSSDSGPGGLNRIDGPAQVDEDLRVGGSSGSDDSDG